jgi:molybdopterin/thiamine biosynthesis adenylyltransferase
MGGEIAEGLVRKGVGTLKLLDFDMVSMSNLSRQFFFPEDLYHPKAWALARNLQPHGAMGTRIIAWALSFEEAQEQGVDLSCDVVVAAADDGRTAVGVSRFATAAGIPAIFGGASRDATYATVFVQEPGGACFGCAFPHEAAEARNPCPGSPAVKDVFMGLGALALYAIDSLCMERPRSWNFHSLCPADPEFTLGKAIPRRADCPICGGA